MEEGAATLLCEGSAQLGVKGFHHRSSSACDSIARRQR